MKVTKNQLALLVFQPAYKPDISQQRSRIFLVCGNPTPFFHMKKKSVDTTLLVKKFIFVYDN